MGVPRIFVLFAATLLASALFAWGQDSPALGDAARQARRQKQEKEAKDTPAPGDTTSKPPKKVVTNDDIPEHVGSTLTLHRSPTSVPDYTPPTSYGSYQGRPEQWKAAIRAQKTSIETMQHAIDSLKSSIRFPEACINDCVQRNERQLQKERQVESMEAQLSVQQKRLEELQEAARKQGFGSATYDP